MAAELTYEAGFRPGTTVPCMYRVITIDGQEVSRELAKFEEVLASNPTVATSYRAEVLAKLKSLVDLFEASSDLGSELHEEAAISLMALDIFILSYTENMLAPVNP